MPAVSRKQQQAAAIALSAKRGEIPISHLRGSSLEMYKSMNEKQLHHFAKTSSLKELGFEKFPI